MFTDLNDVSFVIHSDDSQGSSEKFDYSNKRRWV